MWSLILKFTKYYRLKGLLVGKVAVLTCILSSTPLSLSGSETIINDMGWLTNLVRVMYHCIRVGKHKFHSHLWGSWILCLKIMWPRIDLHVEKFKTLVSAQTPPLSKFVCLFSECVFMFVCVFGKEPKKWYYDNFGSHHYRQPLFGERWMIHREREKWLN